MPQFMVMNDDADLALMVEAKSKMDAKMKVFNLAKDKENPPKAASLQRLVKVAKDKGLNPLVLLRADDLPEILPGIHSLNE